MSLSDRQRRVLGTSVRNNKPRKQLRNLHAAARSRMKAGARRGWSNSFSSSALAAKTRQRNVRDIPLPLPGQRVGFVDSIPAGHVSDREQQDFLEDLKRRRLAATSRKDRRYAYGARRLDTWIQQGRPVGEPAGYALADGKVKSVHKHTSGEVRYAHERNHPEGQIRSELDKMVQSAVEHGIATGRLKGLDPHSRGSKRMAKRWGWKI